MILARALLVLPVTLLLAPLSAQQKPAADKWDITADYGPVSKLAFDTNEGTWMNLDVSPDGKQVVFDLLGDIFIMPVEGTGSGQARTLYWHLPHYTNQGSRPAGAVRDGDWKLVEHYDDDQVQLFNLANDIGESRDLASAEPARAAALREKLRAWRKSVDAQENRPNPAVNQNMYNALYATFDPTRFDPLRANDVEWQKVAEWRKLMNAAVAKPVQ